MDYTERDSFRPDYTGRARALAYSAKGQNLVFWPNPNGEQYYIRYYGTHIGTDASGATQKQRLTLTDDLTLLGDEWEVVYEYFSNLFLEGMSWENHGEWHIDHIIPISTAKSEEEIIRLSHYTNLQPLWAEDNLLKSNKLL
jgi:hypothetical protein